MLKNILKEQFYPILNQFVYVGDVLGDTSPIIWQRVMVGQQILCTCVGPAWKHGLLVIGCLFLHSDWMTYLLRIFPLSFSAGNQICGSLYDIPLM